MSAPMLNYSVINAVKYPLFATKVSGCDAKNDVFKYQK